MKTDPKRTLDAYRARHNEFRVVDVPSLRYLMVDGRGDPNTSVDYADAIAALYPVSYAIKFDSKRALDRDYVVPPLEALWWATDMEAFTSRRDKNEWEWTAMIMVPEWIGRDMVDAAIAAVDAKKAPVALRVLRFESLHEGLCVQTLHIGPYEDEGPILAKMHRDGIEGNGLRMSGKHHEIYLGDVRRADPSRLRTILRQPVVATERA